jgi:tRNA-dihydrouridine synthase
MNTWQTLKTQSQTEKQPIFALAPMEDVTDTVFRQVILKTGKPNVFFTEFMSVEGFMSDKGRNQVNKRLIHTENEKPLIAQIWGITPKYFEQTAKELVKLGFDGIDINMGCPQKKIIKNGGCAGMIGNYTLAKEVIDATKQGAQSQIPISVKTRLGTNHKITEEWGAFLLEQELDELTIHARIAKDMSIPPADWSEIKKIVGLRDKIAPDTIILGNGDVSSYQNAIERVKLSGADGVMVGRGIFKNPWLFNKDIDPEKVPIEEKLELLKFHIDLYEKTWGSRKPLHNLRHYFKIYLSGFDCASLLREKLMECESYDELRSIIHS